MRPPLPPVALLLLQAKLKKRSDDKNLVMIMFNPYCE